MQIELEAEQSSLIGASYTIDNVFGNPYSCGTAFVVAFPVVTAAGEEIILTVLSLTAASGIFQEFQDLP
jgi:hypothetical protein